MARSPARAKVDDTVFPIRVKVSATGWTYQANAETWLRDLVGVGNYASHTSRYGITAFYFRDTDVAHRFMVEFPEFKLIDTSEQAEHIRSAKEWVASGRTSGAHTIRGWVDPVPKD